MYSSVKCGVSSEYGVGIHKINNRRRGEEDEDR